jgi:hypothetical protein
MAVPTGNIAKRTDRRQIVLGKCGDDHFSLHG